MKKYKIEGLSGTTSNPFHFEPDTTNASTTAVTTLDFDNSCVELGGLVDISTYVSGWSASTFVDLRDTSSLIDPTTHEIDMKRARSFFSGLTSVENGYIVNDKTMALFFQCSGLTSFHTDMPKLVDGSFMFIGCSSLNDFSSNMPKITTGNQMFSGCIALPSFTANLDKLYKADGMFGDCLNLHTWSVALPKLWNGTRMFTVTVKAYQGQAGITSWNTELPELVNASHMFAGCGLRTWNTDMRKVTHIGRMFDSCSSLTSCTMNVSSCTYAWGAFYKCSALKSFSGYMPAMTQDASATPDSGDNKGFLNMFEQATSLTSVTIITNQEVADFVTESNMSLRSTATWTRTVTPDNDGLVKITLTGVNK